MHTTNSIDTFIAVAPDSRAERGAPPKESAQPSAALRAYRLIPEHPYRYTSDDVIFTVYADRHGIAARERPRARRVFFAKPQACLRASDLTKKYGWGVHHDGEARVALYGVETAEYRAFVSGDRLGSAGQPATVKLAMRSKRSSVQT